MKRSIIVLGFSLAFSTAALAQTPLERAKAALPAEAGRALEQTVGSAHARGLPTEPLVDKALEGVAKHAPANLILDAVRHRLELLGQADAALRAYGPPAPTDVTSVADALQRGVSVSVVKRVRAGARDGEPVGLAVHTLADLLDRGVPVGVAFDVLSSWRAHDGNADDLRQIPAAVDRLLRAGQSPSAAGRAIAASAGGGRPVSPPGLQKAPKGAPGKGRVGPPVPPGSGAPTRGKPGKRGGPGA
ncbi:MAG TPA: hypothetical protein VF021_04400 [Longimicrobiales bacterium]